MKSSRIIIIKQVSHVGICQKRKFFCLTFSRSFLCFSNLILFNELAMKYWAVNINFKLQPYAFTLKPLFLCRFRFSPNCQSPNLNNNNIAVITLDSRMCHFDRLKLESFQSFQSFRQGAGTTYRFNHAPEPNYTVTTRKPWTGRRY